MPTQARERHRPEHSVLHRVLREHLDGFLAQAREHGGMPRFVEKALRAYLSCGLPEAGFTRIRCARCGHDDILAFSCKTRQLRPSCGARHAADGAAHLVDHVLPVAPFRQWTVSLPWEVRGLLAFRPDVLNAVSRTITRTLNHWQRDRLPADKTHAAGISVLHRFGSSLQVHPHVHSLLVDGVYEENDGTVTLHETPPPTLVDLEEIADRVGLHLRAILKRHGLLDEPDEPAQLDALGQCTLHALNPPTRARAQPAATSVDDDGYADPQGGLAVTVEGVNLHVSSRIAGHDRDALERVCRYRLRAPPTLARLSMPDEDTLLYQLKKPDRRGRTALVLTPHELIGRLSALLPAPRFPLRRAFGLLASGAPLRKLVIPAPSPRCKHRRPTDKPPPPTSSYRLDWATLLRRTFGFTGLECQACGGPMKPIAVIEEPDEIRRYLAHLGLPTELPRAARARAPPAEAA